MIRNVIGIGALALIVIGVWGLWGWQWAAIVGGLPVAGFYLWGEVRAIQGPSRQPGEVD